MMFLRSFPKMGIFFAFFIVVGCNPVNKIDFNEIDALILEYDPHQDMNYSVPIKGSVLIKMKSGELINTDEKRITVATQNIQIRGEKGTIITSVKPTKFSQNIVPVKMSISNSEGVIFSNWDTLRLNFFAPLNLDFRQPKAGSGYSGGDGGQALLFRCGKTGYNGENGRNGINGAELIIHIWKDSSQYFFHVQNVTLNETYYYQSTNERFSINASGGTGGDGGDGGTGGNGKDAENYNNKTKSAGDGGDGGNGGNAGFGGNGGSVMCYIHPSATAIQNNISISVNPGSPGQPGKGGLGGKPGKNTEGATPANPGRNGINGVTSTFGQRGVSSITQLDFDYTQLKK